MVYRNISNITSITTNNQTKHFNYDLVDRVTSYKGLTSDDASNDASSVGLTQDYQNFSYDANGNRVTLNQETNKTISYTYKENSNILQTIKHIKRVDQNTTQIEKEINLQYDAIGNIIQDDKHSYTYDLKNRLVRVDNNITYRYDYENKRVSKTVNNQTTYYIYDGYKLLGEYSQDGEPIKEYIYYNDTPIAIIQNNTIYYIYTDHLNTPRRVATTDNNIIWSWESKPFGETKPNEDPDKDNTTFTLNLRFPGQYYDSETNTHYNINRDYNPLISRYMQSDPIGFDGGVNSYLYVGGNPISAIDPEGKNLLIKGIVWGVQKVWRGIVWASKTSWKYVKGIFIKTKIPENSIEHIFSNKHIKNGIMNLGRDKEDIIKRIEKVVDKALDALDEGSNQIHVKINGYDAEVRVFVKDGKILSIDAFKGRLTRIFGKLIELSERF